MFSATLLCFVLFVIDGDKLVATCDHKQIVVRLAEIDAPEQRQDFWLRSKRSLIEMCLYKNATVTPKKIDQNERVIAYVNCSGTDVNSEQIRRGMAWVFERYVTDKSLYTIQNKAQSSHIGLWEYSSPTPPWEWRETQQRASKEMESAILRHELK